MKLDNLISSLRKIFRLPTQGEHLEQYINSRHPKFAADVEHLERQYWNRNYTNQRGEWL